MFTSQKYIEENIGKEAPEEVIRKAIAEAKANLADVELRGEAAIGSNWQDVRKELFTAEELAQSDLKVSVIGEMIRARLEKGISQSELEEMSGIKQKQIEGFERGSLTPRIDTLQKLLLPLGKKLAIVPI